jgi:hypothetical protein
MATTSQWRGRNTSFPSLAPIGGEGQAETPRLGLVQRIDRTVHAQLTGLHGSARRISVGGVRMSPRLPAAAERGAFGRRSLPILVLRQPPI